MIIELLEIFIDLDIYILLNNNIVIIFFLISFYSCSQSKTQAVQLTLHSSYPERVLDLLFTRNDREKLPLVIVILPC
jgi:hypothetical protein